MPNLPTSEGRTSMIEGNTQVVSCTPKWKWDEIAMDFILGLPNTATREDSIWVMVDRLTKNGHFILVKVKNPKDKLARVYVQIIVRLHGVPSAVISYKDS
jgi:hypothetical protein